jgi:hypothetical protein
MPAHLTFKERDEFRLRLRACLRNVGINPNRPGELLLAFMQSGQGAAVTASSVFKWLQGESLPAANNMEIVASICKVCPVWLRTGHFPAEANALTSTQTNTATTIEPNAACPPASYPSSEASKQAA